MNARMVSQRGTIVLTVLAALIVGLVLGLAVPAQSQAKGAAPVTVVDGDNPDHVAAVDDTGALKVSGEVDVGAVEVGNLPETQDVLVTNGRADAVPVSLDVAPGAVTVNSFSLTAEPGETDEFVEFFQAINMFFASVTGATDGELIVFLDNNLNGVMVLRGETGSGIGQADYDISLTHLIPLSGVRLSCPDSASTTCEVFVSVTGYF